MPAGKRPRLLVLNQYYTPGVEATAHLLGELCEELAQTFDVTVITGMVRTLEPGRRVENGVEVVRVPSTTYDRRQLRRRALNYLTYLFHALRAGLAAGRPDVVLCMTDPPVIANVALVVARRARAPLVVVSQDVFPEIAVRLKRLENAALVGLLRMLIAAYLRRADRVVAIGTTMRGRLIEKGAPPERVHVIPNWVDTKELGPHERDNDWSREHGVSGCFVVMHSGNIGHAQNLDSLIRSATFLRDLDRLAVLLVGAGARLQDYIELREQLEVDSVRFLPYQPRELLPLSLSSADVHVVGLARGLSGYVVPSRLYGILAVGRPVIVAADADSETARMISEAECGIVVPPGRPERLATVIRSAYDGELPLEEMGRRARDYVVATADREIAFARYRDLLLDLVPGMPA
jgi:glycosyltransferase involved in cell wall biosynthesis